nr:class I SAM-dependent methyltransferase [uncultured Caproiciproducens sp.]
MTNEIKYFFDKCAETWDNCCSYDQEKIAAIVTLAGITAGSRIVDVACGTGVMFPEMLSRNPAMILGVDLSDEMIAKAHSKFTDSRLQLLASDLFDVHETGFDTAIIFSAYPHFSDKSKLSEHISKLLKVGGRVMIAHCESRNSINYCHTGRMVSKISWPLRSAKEEAAEFSNYFNIDILADTSEIYLFSGIKR